MPPFLLQGFPVLFPAFGAGQMDDDFCAFTQIKISCNHAGGLSDSAKRGGRLQAVFI